MADGCRSAANAGKERKWNAGAPKKGNNTLHILHLRSILIFIGLSLFVRLAFVYPPFSNGCFTIKLL